MVIHTSCMRFGNIRSDFGNSINPTLRNNRKVCGLNKYLISSSISSREHTAFFFSSS
ncbi:hypothetical protein THF5H11_20391 [Vibrio jasicida]|nr:hypothetical protein THF5H11_20391 [Vibrio jasicida]